MKALNRSVAIIKPKQPYIDWANSFDDGGPTLELDSARANATAYLISNFNYPDQAIWYVKKNCRTIFENELWGWMTDPALWPKKRTYKVFMEWFDVEIGDMVHDLCSEPLVLEKD